MNAPLRLGWHKYVDAWIALLKGRIDHVAASTIKNILAGVGIHVDITAGVATISNTGVLAVDAGPGIGVDESTGIVTVSNTGVLAVDAGTGIGVGTAAGVATVTNTGVTSIAAGPGISIDEATGAVTITGTAVSFDGAHNPADVPVAATDTVVATMPVTIARAGQVLQMHAIATFQNISEALGQPSDCTLALFLDGVELAVSQQSDTVATGVAFCCTSSQARVAPAVGVHSVTLVATATAAGGNCQIPANQGSIDATLYG